jgi:hypothetical protein
VTSMVTTLKILILDTDWRQFSMSSYPIKGDAYASGGVCILYIEGKLKTHPTLLTHASIRLN